MNEDEARQWIGDRWGAAAMARLLRLVDAVIAENQRQNLISPASISTIWARHIADSAQLVPLAAHLDGPWIDIGTGGGFPGLVVAALREDAITLVEPRALRATFLKHAAIAMGLTNVQVVQARAERVEQRAYIVSARAVASLDALLCMAERTLVRNGEGLFARGETGRAELADVEKQWRGLFHVEQSITNPASIIVRVSQLERR